MKSEPAVCHSLTAAGCAVLAALLLALTACGADPPGLPRLASDATVLAFGDSLTYGTGAKEDESYPEVLSQIIGREVINAGVPGETTAGGLARLPRVLEEIRPDLVILCLGGNDFLRKQDPAQTRTNLERMIQMVRGAGVPLVLVAVPQPRLFSGPPPLYRELAKAHGLPLEEEVLDDVLRDNALKSDPIHPNAAGYRRIAQALAELLRESGAI
ncbi:MAG TPA: arylesterase [Nevskiales bacterium]|nr:arylesterase [Nevskiales bacterium]